MGRIDPWRETINTNRRAKWREPNSQYRAQKTAERLRRQEKKRQVILKAQNGKCAICGKVEVAEFRGTLLMLSRDHDHITGQLRAWLCRRCNLVLGQVEDDVELLQQMIRYLQRYQTAEWAKELAAKESREELSHSNIDGVLATKA